MERDSQLARRARAYLGAPALALVIVACGGGDAEVALEPTTEFTTEATDTTTTAEVDETTTSAAAEPSDETTTSSEETTTTAAVDTGRPAIQVLSADEAIANAEANIGSLVSAENIFDIEVLAVADGSAQTVRDVVTGDRPVLLWFFSPH